MIIGVATTFNKNNTYAFELDGCYIVQLINDNPIGLSDDEWIEHFMKSSIRKSKPGKEWKVCVVKKINRLKEREPA